VELSLLLSGLADQFKAAGIESARADAEILAADLLGLSRGELAVQAITGFQVSPSDLERIKDLAAKRAERVPLQHLTGKAYFRNLELSVGPGVFVPRPETEGVVQIGIDALQLAVKAEGHPIAANPPIAVDLGTGSGAIALAMATEVPQAKVYAVELSDEAMPWTTKNFAKYGAPVDAELRQGDLADAFQDLNGKVSVVVSNPPYIPNAMVPIYPEVHLHDPALALYGGDDGLDLIRKVSKTAQRLLVPGGTLVIEHADIQSPAVVQLLLADGWNQVQPHQDFNQRFRSVSAVR
jgi:release factor glutamine methyltransferase